VGDCFSPDRIRWGSSGSERAVMRGNARERERKDSDKGEADVDRKEPEHTARYGYYDRKADRNGICTGRNRRLGTWTIAPRQPLTDIFGQAFLGICSPFLHPSFCCYLPFTYPFPIYSLLFG